MVITVLLLISWQLINKAYVKLDEFAEYEEDEDEDYQLVHHERVVEKKKWESIKKAQLERSSDHEGFYAELEHSVDGFATVAAYFGKTVVFEKGIAS